MSCELFAKGQKQNVIHGQFCFSIQNIGKGIAQWVEFQWEDVAAGNAEAHIESLPVDNLRKAELNVLAYCDNSAPYQGRARLKIKYSDLLNNRYTQTVTLFFVLYPSEIKFLKCYIDVPVPLLRENSDS